MDTLLSLLTVLSPSAVLQNCRQVLVRFLLNVT